MAAVTSALSLLIPLLIIFMRQTVDVEDMLLAYLPGNALRVRVRVAGQIATKANQNGSSSVSQ